MKLYEGLFHIWHSLHCWPIWGVCYQLREMLPACKQNSIILMYNVDQYTIPKEPRVKLGMGQPLVWGVFKRWKFIFGLKMIHLLLYTHMFCSNVNGLVVSSSLQNSCDTFIGVFVVAVYSKLETRNGITTWFFALKSNDFKISAVSGTTVNQIYVDYLICLRTRIISWQTILLYWSRHSLQLDNFQ